MNWKPASGVALDARTSGVSSDSTDRLVPSRVANDIWTIALTMKAMFRGDRHDVRHARR